MFEPFEKSRQDFPVDSYRKVIFCENMSAGKSSLAQCIIYRADKPADYHYNPSQCVEGVELETAGINYHNVVVMKLAILFFMILLVIMNIIVVMQQCWRILC